MTPPQLNELQAGPQKGRTQSLRPGRVSETSRRGNARVQDKIERRSRSQTQVIKRSHSKPGEKRRQIVLRRDPVAIQDARATQLSKLFHRNGGIRRYGDETPTLLLDVALCLGIQTAKEIDLELRIVSREQPSEIATARKMPESSFGGRVTAKQEGPLGVRHRSFWALYTAPLARRPPSPTFLLLSRSRTSPYFVAQGSE